MTEPKRSTEKKVKVAVLCGGPSKERGISLNSARSLCDHLEAEDLEIIPFYFDTKKRAYKISRKQLYSNTPSDFDFKLQQNATSLTKAALKQELQSCDIAYPVIHGAFGEDGELQGFLEKLKVPFVGPGKRACEKSFDKAVAHEAIRAEGFYVPPYLALESTEMSVESKIRTFFKQNNDVDLFIVKPAGGGSSLGVHSVRSPEEAKEKFTLLTKEEHYTKVIIEPFCKGREFTVIVVENRFGLPVALPAIEIETSYADGAIFDYRKKYLAGNRVRYHCPARFSADTLQKISIQSEQLFSLFGIKGVSRFDGWLLEDGRLWFSDFNPVSGMEQNSFMFIASSEVGMSHADIVRYLVKRECDRNGIPLAAGGQKRKRERKNVGVLFGGTTAERQVSLMSGTNVWLKLRGSEAYDPQPYLLESDKEVWKLPYSYTLNHTVEEVLTRCKEASELAPTRTEYHSAVIQKLALLPGQSSLEQIKPQKLSLKSFLEKSERIFNTVHGGIGENGELQKKMQQAGIAFNGSDAVASELCMDKYRTGAVVSALDSPAIRTARKKLVKTAELKNYTEPACSNFFSELIAELASHTLIVKPTDDGCSAGIARLFNAGDLQSYLEYLFRGDDELPAGTLSRQAGIVEMPSALPPSLLFEEFIETDKVSVKDNKLNWQHENDWIEVTVGVLGLAGRMKALSPSITVASGDVLSLEEKFQGGTGVNITPPPEEYVSSAAIAKTRKHIAKVANALGVGGYARIDAFMHRVTGDVVIIEANSLPGLTGSTVIFHQALEESPAMYPREFLEKIVSLGEKRQASS